MKRVHVALLVLLLAACAGPPPADKAELHRRQEIAKEEVAKQTEEDKKQAELRAWEASSHWVAHILVATAFAYDPKSRACWAFYAEGQVGFNHRTISLNHVPCAVARPYLPPSQVKKLEEFGEVTVGNKAEAEEADLRMAREGWRR